MWFWFFNISSFHFRRVQVHSSLCYYPYTELKNLQKEKKMKNSPTKVCSSSVQQDKMIISHYKQEINTIDEETFLNDFTVIINDAKYTLKLLR